MDASRDGLNKNINAGSAYNIMNIKPLASREGYPQWKFKVRMYLLHEDLWCSIVGYPEGDTTSESVRKLKDLKALTKICLTLDGGAITHARNSESAKDVWKALQNAYEDNSMGRQLSLERRLYRYELNDFPSIEEYINAIVNTAQDLADIGKKIEDSSIGAILLGGLTKEFDPLVMALENSNVVITADLVKSKLLSEMEKRNSKDIALASTSKQPYKKTREVVCYHCKQPGHKRPNCPNRKKVKSKEEKANNTSVLSALGAGDGLSRTDWYIDSGASAHMTGNKDWLSDFREEHLKTDVTIADNSKLYSAGVGNVVLKDNEHISSISDVIYVPNLGTNLISVNKAVNKGITVVFNKKGCSLYRNVKVSGKLIGHGTFSGGLYKFDNSVVAAPEQAMVADNVSLGSDIWHRRLGHLCRVGLDQLRRGKAEGINFSNIDKNPCVACIEGKQIRKPFKPIPYEKGNKMLEVVHSDLCGPFNVTSLEGNKYFLIFVDDFSRMIFIYFIKSKTEVRNKFKEFQTQVERETSCKIKILRTDNGTEYVNHEFSNYLKSQGIQHQTTVPYSPQQNGVAERTNRSVVEKARCMLQDSHLPKTFWEEAARTAVYLKNRCPHRALRNFTPYEKWFGKKPHLSNLRVFGCHAYVHIPDCERHKLDAKAKKYIFVGYCTANNSYRFRDPTCIRKVVKARDVVFMENCFSNNNVTEQSKKCQDIILNSDDLQVVDLPLSITEGRTAEPLELQNQSTDVNRQEVSDINREEDINENSDLPGPADSSEESEVKVSQYNLRPRQPVKYCHILCSGISRRTGTLFLSGGNN